MRTTLCLGITCLLAASTARATVIGGTSTTQPLPYNGNNTYVYIFGGPGSQLAVPFTPVAGFDYTLSSASLPVRSYGPTEVEIDIFDTNGSNPGSKLEGLTAQIPSDFGYHLVGGNFSGSNILHGGQQYFFYVIAPNGSGQVDWAGAAPDVVATIYYQANTGFWNHAQSFSSPAFQVVSASAAAPEPGTILLLSAGALLLMMGRTWKP